MTWEELNNQAKGIKITSTTAPTSTGWEALNTQAKQNKTTPTLPYTTIIPPTPTKLSDIITKPKEIEEIQPIKGGAKAYSVDGKIYFPETKPKATDVISQGTFERTEQPIAERQKEHFELATQKYIEEGKIKNVVLDDWFKSFVSGIGGVVEGVVGAAEWISPNAMKPFFKEKGDQLSSWQRTMTPDEMNFVNKLIAGAGSAATFFIPGLGAAKGASVLAKVSPKIALLFGNSVSTTLEAMTEAGSVYRQNIASGMNESKAGGEATKTFLANSILIGLTNKFGIFSDKTQSAIKKVLLSAPLEGFQEAGQEIISNVTTGEKDPFEGALESGIIGAILGAGMSSMGTFTGIIPSEKSSEKDIKKAIEEIEKKADIITQEEAPAEKLPVETAVKEQTPADKLISEIKQPAETPATKLSKQIKGEVVGKKTKEDLDYLLSETISPSKSIIDPNLPISGLKTKESPSLIKTLSPAGASKSIRYISPSQLYNFDDKLSIYGNYSKVKKISQSNKNLFKENIKIATGLNPNVRIKSKESFESKIKRYNIAKKDISTISDSLAGRIIVKNEDIDNQLSNIVNNFKIKEVKNYFENPTIFGYRGINITTELTDGLLAEIQIHTPESLVVANKIHKIYEKWRNVNINNLSEKQIKEFKKDIDASKKISSNYFKETGTKKQAKPQEYKKEEKPKIKIIPKSTTEKATEVSAKKGVGSILGEELFGIPIKKYKYSKQQLIDFYNQTIAKKVKVKPETKPISKEAKKFLEDYTYKQYAELTPEIEKELSRYRPEKPVRLYRAQKKGVGRKPLESWTYEEGMAKAMIGEPVEEFGPRKPGMEVISKIIKPDEILVDNSKLPADLRKELIESEVIVKGIKTTGKLEVIRYATPETENTDSFRGGTWYMTPESKEYKKFFAKRAGEERQVGGNIKYRKKITIKNPLVIPNADIGYGSYALIDSGYENYLPKRERDLAKEFYDRTLGAEEFDDIPISRAINDIGKKAGFSEKEIWKVLMSTNQVDAMFDKIIGQGLGLKGYDALILQGETDTHIFKLAKEKVIKEVKPIPKEFESLAEEPGTIKKAEDWIGSWISPVIKPGYKEITKPPTQEVINVLSKYKPTKPVKLYRGISAKSRKNTLGLESWTYDKDLAEEWVKGLKGAKVISRVVSPDEILVDFTKAPSNLNGEDFGMSAKEIKEVIVKTGAKPSPVTPTKTEKAIKESAEKGFSLHYEKIKKEFGFDQRFRGVEYEKISTKDQIKKAFNYINRFPKQSMQIAYGLREAPAGINSQAIRQSLYVSLKEAGKKVEADAIARITSKKFTEVAQTLNIAKADLGIKEETAIMQSITNERMLAIGEKAGKVNPEEAIAEAKRQIKEKTKKATQEVVENQSKPTKNVFEQIDKLVDSIIC